MISYTTTIGDNYVVISCGPMSDVVQVKGERDSWVGDGL